MDTISHILDSIYPVAFFTPLFVGAFWPELRRWHRGRMMVRNANHWRATL